MAKITDVANIWKNVRELDLRPIRESAEQPMRVALLGKDGSGRHTLAGQMRVDPSRPSMRSDTSVLIGGLEMAAEVPESDLVILVVDAQASDFIREQELARSLINIRKKVLVFVNKIDLIGEGPAPDTGLGGQGFHLVSGSAIDPGSLSGRFVPAVIDILSARLLALARQFPLFRVPIAHQLINETCLANAAYSLSTGLAEIVPIFDVPLNLADIVVLTKAQAFLVYKLGLAFGFSTHWQDYVAEFGSVVGGGFLWRQVARFLIGLIPVWGIVPKVGVAYSGTYVVGMAVLQWYLTGRHLTRQQMRELSAQAFTRGKALAQNLQARLPKPRLSLPRPRLGRRKAAALPEPRQGKDCPACGKTNAADASFCQYCGHPLEESPVTGET